MSVKERAYNSFENAKAIAVKAKKKAGDAVKKAADKSGNKIAQLSCLTSAQLEDVQKLKEFYYEKMVLPDGTEAEELTSRLLASTGIEIYNAHLSKLHELYVPVDEKLEYEKIELDEEGKPQSKCFDFNSDFNIRYINITRWVTDKNENSLEKLVNVYDVLSDEECNIALVFNRKQSETDVYLAVVNKRNDSNSTMADSYKKRLVDAIRGNFPGSAIGDEGRGTIPCLNNKKRYSVASVSNIPTEKSEKFISQTIEKLLDGIIPSNSEKEYTIILLATPVKDSQDRKLRLSELYTGLAPYAGWQTGYTFNESQALGSSATFGVNAGVSAGVQNGNNSTITDTGSYTEQRNRTNTDSVNRSQNIYSSDTEGEQRSRALSRSQSQGITNTEGLAVTDVSSRTSSFTDTNSVTDNTNWSSSSSDNVTGSLSITESAFESASVTAGVDAGVEATATATGGVGLSSTQGLSTGHTDTLTNGGGQAISQAIARGVSNTVGRNVTNSINRAISSSASQAITNTIGNSISRTVGSGRTEGTGRSVAQSIGNALTNSVSNAAGIYKGTNFGGNFGANFARSSNVTAMVGSNESITQFFTNYTIKHTLEILEDQMKRYEESTALGMWDFAAYVLSEDSDVASNVAHTYLALTQGEKSYFTQAAINVWRGDVEESGEAQEICKYLRTLRHPIFGLDPYVALMEPYYNVYPSVVTATTSLSGKELAYSLNFPKHSIAGLPVVECTEFGRNIASYDNNESINPDNELQLGNIFHMNAEEKIQVNLNIDSLASHAFVTGSTGSGKSNTVYKILEEAISKDIGFTVIEPAKGEYKDVFGNRKDVNVYGTNAMCSPLLRINPFNFPDKIHVLEHIDRLIEVFNVCWPMYAAMPAVLKNAVEKAYEDCGWDLVKSVNRYGKDLFPSFVDITRNVREIIDESDYDKENKGAYKGALITRLQSLTNGINGLVFTSNEISNEFLFDSKTIIDLSRVGSTETKSLLMGIIVLKLQEYRMSEKKQMNSSLRHLTILEEAHNILKRTSTEQFQESSNLLGKSVEMLAASIAEMRTYGEGFIIVDQSPSAVDMSSIRNTNTKIILRLPEYGDREIVGKAAGLNDDQITELTKLPRGVAAIYQNDWISPVLCKVSKVDYENNGYEYTKPILPNEEQSNTSDAIEIIELLSKGTRVEESIIINEMKPRLQSMNVSASTQFTAYEMMRNPGSEPRMTKMALVVSELLPNTISCVKEAYKVSSDPKEWTHSVEDYIVKFALPDQVRRDVIQAAITFYFKYVVSDMNVLRDWSNRGGLI
ncbi:MAG: DUF87 domain-containing protein [Saccharofermentans sp.]|nr:DUF87 domain-containing protein [Saccharofermentans sp.]